MGVRKELLKRRWISYNAAKVTVQDEGVSTRDQYYAWWEKNKPVGMPKYPHRVYLTEWKGWNDFLNNDNTFHVNRGGNYRSYFEALKWVQKQGFKTKNEYTFAYNKGLVPKDIPKLPDRYYKEWVTWPLFLGVRVQDKLAAAKINTAILAICIPTTLPNGYILPLIAKDGEAELRERLAQAGNLRAIKLYVWETEKTAWFKEVLMRCGSPQDDNLWLIRNINEVIYQLDQTLDWYRPRTS